MHFIVERLRIIIINFSARTVKDSRDLWKESSSLDLLMVPPKNNNKESENSARAHTNAALGDVYMSVGYC